MAPRSLRESVARVVADDNCTGCGACAALSPGIRMQLDAAGYWRPTFTESVSAPADPGVFAAICPGVGVTAARWPGATMHPILGPYVSAWTAWATAPDVRHAGSSGGVLTALSAWLLETGVAGAVIGATMDQQRPSRTVALELRTREQVLAASGSRYAPVGNAALARPGNPDTAFVGKPCEVYAVRKLSESRPGADAPVLLSFFCAGIPSQSATDKLVTAMGVDLDGVTDVRYRGQGWPGEFVATDRSGTTGRRSYEESWGRHLGPHVQARCKICPDGTGGHADIAVGDYWRADASGFPVFADADGLSVAIARTERGHQLLLGAQQAGVLTLGPISLDEVAAIQPLQTKRVTTLAGRLVGLALAGNRIPRMRGYALLRRACRAPRQNFTAARGALGRARARRRTSKKG